MTFPKRITGLHVFVGIVIAMIAAVIVTGLYVAGSPQQERERQFDQRRLNDLQSISGAADSYFQQTGRLPASVGEIATGDKTRGYYISSTNDPQTAVPYEYRTTDVSTYELCAVFDLASDDTNAPGTKGPTPAMPYPYPVAVGSRTWSHGPGRQCFSLDAEPIIGNTCSLRQPCPAGNICASLPTLTGTVCVPEGKECAAAGCPGQCTMSQSYPVQVSCTTAPAPKPAK